MADADAPLIRKLNVAALAGGNALCRAQPERLLGLHRGHDFDAYAAARLES
jgi:hypothetical protein